MIIKGCCVKYPLSPNHRTCPGLIFVTNDLEVYFKGTAFIQGVRENINPQNCSASGGTNHFGVIFLRIRSMIFLINIKKKI